LKWSSKKKNKIIKHFSERIVARWVAINSLKKRGTRQLAQKKKLKGKEKRGFQQKKVSNAGTGAVRYRKKTKQQEGRADVNGRPSKTK